MSGMFFFFVCLLFFISLLCLPCFFKIFINIVPTPFLVLAVIVRYTVYHCSSELLMVLMRAIHFSCVCVVCFQGFFYFRYMVELLYWPWDLSIHDLVCCDTVLSVFNNHALFFCYYNNDALGLDISGTQFVTLGQLWFHLGRYVNFFPSIYSTVSHWCVPLWVSVVNKYFTLHLVLVVNDLKPPANEVCSSFGFLWRPSFSSINHAVKKNSYCERKSWCSRLSLFIFTVLVTFFFTVVPLQIYVLYSSLWFNWN